MDFFGTFLRELRRPESHEGIQIVIDLRPYCVKCGSRECGTHFHPGSGYSSGGCGRSYTLRARAEAEHLHYVCKNCGYDWTGPCRDAQHEYQVGDPYP